VGATGSTAYIFVASILGLTAYPGWERKGDPRRPSRRSADDSRKQQEGGTSLPVRVNRRLSILTQHASCTPLSPWHASLGYTSLPVRVNRRLGILTKPIRYFLGFCCVRHVGRSMSTASEGVLRQHAPYITKDTYYLVLNNIG